MDAVSPRGLHGVRRLSASSYELCEPSMFWRRPGLWRVREGNWLEDVSWDSFGEICPLHVLNSGPGCSRSRHDLGNQNSEENIPSGNSRVQDPVHSLGLRGSVSEMREWIWTLGFRPSSQVTTEDLPSSSCRHYINRWVCLCSNNTVLMDTKISILYNFHVSWNIVLIFFQLFKNIKIILFYYYFFSLGYSWFTILY